MTDHWKVVKNKDIDYSGVKMDTDHDLHTNLAPPLDIIRNGSLILIVGSSGSGKTSLLVNLVSKKTKCKQSTKKQSLHKCFHKVVMCSPSLKTLKKDVFKIPKEQKFTCFHKCMHEIEGLIEPAPACGDEDEDDETLFNLLILDDVATSLKECRDNELLLTRLLQNRRHKNLTTIVLVQKWNHLPTGICNNANVVFIFRPKTMQEQESICKEILPIHPRECIDLFNWVFDKAFVHLMIDMTLLKSNTFRYFKNFELIEGL